VFDKTGAAPQMMQYTCRCHCCNCCSRDSWCFWCWLSKKKNNASKGNQESALNNMPKNNMSNTYV
jgi:hypothetical protein